MRATRGQLILLGSIGFALCFLVLMPIGALLVGSFTTGRPGAIEDLTLSHYSALIAESDTYTLVAGTAFFALCSTLLALAIGAVLAFVVVRTDAPLRQVIHGTVIALFTIPVFIHALMWILVLSPRIGLYNILLMRALGTQSPPFDIYTWSGLILVQSLAIMPLAYLALSSALRSVDNSLEEAARVHGGGVGTILVRILLPVLRPTFLSTGLLLLVLSFEAFFIPQVIGVTGGIYLFTTTIYGAVVSFPPAYGRATTLSLLTVASVAILVLMQRTFLKQGERFMTVTGKGMRQSCLKLGPWRHLVTALAIGFLIITVVVPLLLLLYVSLQPFYEPFRPEWRLTAANFAALIRDPKILSGTLNSMVLGVAAATVIVLLTSLSTYTTERTRLPGRSLLDLLATAPVSLPGIALALGLLWAYLFVPVGIYGTPLMLLVGFITKYLPYGQRILLGGMRQLHTELEEASRTTGGGWFATFRRIVFPLIKPSLLASWVITFTLVVKDISTAVLLASPGSEVLSTIFLKSMEAESLSATSALAVYIIAILFAVIVISQRSFRFHVQ